MTRRSNAWLVSSVFTFAFGLATPLAAQQGPPTVGVEVENTTANPVPVVVTGGRVEELITFRSGYQVPTGKRLLVDDVSISCLAVGALPASPTTSGSADFERFGISATVLLRIAYSVADCPETPSRYRSRAVPFRTISSERPRRTARTLPEWLTAEAKPIHRGRAADNCLCGPGGNPIRRLQRLDVEFSIRVRQGNRPPNRPT